MNATCEQIMVVCSAAEGKDEIRSAIQRGLPASEVTICDDVATFHQTMQGKECDLVVLDYDLAEVRLIEFLASLRLRDDDPDILIVSSLRDAEALKLVSESRQRFVVRDARWLDSLVLAARDILRIRKLEDEMARVRARLTEANWMLEERNRRLDEFCSTVAHDIRGPLGALMLKVEYIIDAYGGDLDAKCVGLLQRSLESAGRLTDIVQAMYEFAKLGTKATKLVEFDLRSLVEQVVADLDCDESLDIRIGIGQLPKVWGNEALLRRVFINLIQNSIKYTDKREIVINIGAGQIVDRNVAHFVDIFIEDNGPGIPSEDLEKIFLMFRRGSSDRSNAKEGLGIGLAVVQRIIELHYGRIQVESSVGKGTRFTFSLPVEPVRLAQ